MEQSRWKPLYIKLKQHQLFLMYFFRVVLSTIEDRVSVVTTGTKTLPYGAGHFLQRSGPYSVVLWTYTRTEKAALRTLSLVELYKEAIDKWYSAQWCFHVHPLCLVMWSFLTWPSFWGACGRIIFFVTALYSSAHNDLPYCEFIVVHKCMGGIKESSGKRGKH